MSEASPLDENAVHQALEKAGQRTAKHHLFFCVGPNCCSPEQGQKTWEYAKATLREQDVPAMRTKAACLRICQGGPWLIVYPEGCWYGQVTPERFDRIAHEHLIQNRPVKEWVQAENGLSRDAV